MKKIRFGWMKSNKKKTPTREDRYPNRPENENVEYYVDAKNQIKRRKK